MEQSDAEWEDIAISIHAPNEGERPETELALPKMEKEFQSTLPTRGSDVRKRRFCTDAHISIHAPHEGERL